MAEIQPQTARYKDMTQTDTLITLGFKYSLTPVLVFYVTRSFSLLFSLNYSEANTGNRRGVIHLNVSLLSARSGCDVTEFLICPFIYLFIFEFIYFIFLNYLFFILCMHLFIYVFPNINI